MVALGGMGAALAVLSMPVGLVEMLVASSGMTEMLPSAAPPLGMKARLLVAAFAALMAIGTIAVLRRDPPSAGTIYSGRGRGKRVQGARKMGFALSRLTALARGRRGSPVHRDAPVLRRADAHPDAPARAPIYASRDFVGLDIFARTEPGHRALIVKAEPKRDPIVPAAGLDMPGAPLPLPDDMVAQPGFASLFAVRSDVSPDPAIGSGMADETPTSEEGPVAAPEMVACEPPAPPAQETMSPGPDMAPVAAMQRERPDSIQELSISELTERLERGLAARRPRAAPPACAVLADLPVAPPVPVRETVAEDIDEALRAALGTLRTMAARGR